MIGGQSYSDKEALDVLATRLPSIPTIVFEHRSVTLGQYQGLAFGLFLSPVGNPEVFVEGAIMRMTPLARDHHGPRAILNAVERIMDSYDAQCDRTRHDLTLARTQLRDFEARLGTAFPHDAYVTELTDLRNRLKAALANLAEHGAEIPVLTERFTTLTASQAIETTPNCPTQRQAATVAEPVTTRILETIKKALGQESKATPLVPVAVAAPSSAPVPVAPFTATQPSLFDAPLSHRDTPKPLRRQPGSRPATAPTGQLRLW
jgi:hypothetical protein